MTPSVGLVPVHGLHLFWLSPHIPKPFLKPWELLPKGLPNPAQARPVAEGWERGHWRGLVLPRDKGWRRGEG